MRALTADCERTVIDIFPDKTGFQLFSRMDEGWLAAVKESISPDESYGESSVIEGRTKY